MIHVTSSSLPLYGYQRINPRNQMTIYGNDWLYLGSYCSQHIQTFNLKTEFKGKHMQP